MTRDPDSDLQMTHHPANQGNEERGFSYIEDMTERKFSYNFKNIILLRLTAAPGPTVHAVQRQR